MIARIKKKHFNIRRKVDSEKLTPTLFERLKQKTRSLDCAGKFGASLAAIKRSVLEQVAMASS